MNWRIRRKKFPGIKDRDITTDMSWSVFVSGFMLFFLGGRGEARCFGEVEIVFEVDNPPPSKHSSKSTDKRRAEKVSGPPTFALVFYNKLTRNDFAVCTKVNSYNLWFSARHVKPITTVFLYAEREDLDLERLELERYKSVFVNEVVLIGVCNKRFPSSVVRHFPLNKPSLRKEF